MKPILSICMMVKNEEKDLERCLRSLQPLIQGITSELIIVDTGSSDRTVEIAKQFTDKVFFHTWNNDFSEMRNISIGYATGQWVLIIDADEELETGDDIIRFLKARPDSRIGCGTALVKNITDDLKGHYATAVSPRLFRRNKHFRYRGTVHNEPLFQGGIINLKCRIMHYGYITSDKELMERKFQRTSALLLAELTKSPDNVYYRYQLSISYSMHGDWEEALQELIKIYEHNKEKDDGFWYSNLFVIGGLLQACVANKCFDDDFIKFGIHGIKLEPEYVDLYFFLAQLYEMKNDFEEAYKYYAKHEDVVKNFSGLKLSQNMALQYYTLSHLTIDYFNMGVISVRNGEYIRARQHFQQMLEVATLDDPFISQARSILIGLDFQDKDFIASRVIYETLMEKSLDQELANVEMEMENLWKNLPKANQLSFCQQFESVPNLYGKLNRLRLCDGDIGEAEWRLLIDALSSRDINTLPDYYAPVLAYSLKFRPQEAWKISAGLSEQTIVGYMSYMDEVDKVVFVNFCRDYVNLSNDNLAPRFSIDRLRKNISKYLLFSGQLDDAEYFEIFKLYLNWGQSYLEFLYKDMVFKNELIYDLKNKEEVFLLYMTLANRIINDRNSYIHYLNKALKAFPEMHKGISSLINSFRENSIQVNSEMAELKIQLHKHIQTLLDAGEGLLAKNVIDEYEQICGSDMESLMFKSQAMLLID